MAVGSGTASQHDRGIVKSTDSEIYTDLDVLIVGGGVVGCSLARQLLLQTPYLRIGLVEARSGPSLGSDDRPFPEIPNPRSYALSPQSLEWLGLINSDPNGTNDSSASDDEKLTNPEIPLDRLGYYSSMQVWEAGHPASLLFQANKDIASDHLGAIVEDEVVVHHLWRHISGNGSDTQVSGNPVEEVPNGCSVWTNCSVADLQMPSQSTEGVVKVHLKPSSPNQEPTSLVEPAKIRTQLLIGADGAQSMIRKLTGIPRSLLEYNQQALTFTVELASSHQQRTFQRFLPQQHGPIALLPTFSPEHAIVVWSTTPELAQQWKDPRPIAAQEPQSLDELVNHINELFQQGPELLSSLIPSSMKQTAPQPLVNLMYGAEKLYESLAHYGPSMLAQEQGGSYMAPPVIESIVSPRFAFPLSCAQVSSYIAPRLALVGDAAHSVHPMAGQGLNLGLQDASELLRVINKSYQAGMDISLFLQEYDTNRKMSVSATLSGIHVLHQMFQQHNTPLQHVKSMGINFIQNVPPLRKQLAQAACHGIVLPTFSTPTQSQ